MSYQIDKLINTPQLMLNTILSWKATKHLRLHTHLQYYGKQQVFHLEPISYATYSGLLEHYAQLQLQEMESPGSIAPEEFSEVETKLEYYSSRASVQKDYSGRFLVNVGANYTIGNIELGLDVHNLFNHHYTQSGMSTGLIPQKGLWLLGSISYRF
jgi:outer membrane receptor for ferrienterochelin and colicin